MGRKKVAQKREILPDPKYNDIVIAKFINVMMIHGKKNVAERIFYDTLDLLAKKTNDDPLKLFKKALENLKPIVEVKSRRVGGATYQVPVEVKPHRRQSLASRWLIDYSNLRSEKSFQEKLTAEVLDVLANRGGAIKKRDDVHKMAEANKAFAHYRW
ncbi:MAG: 30S ribosomal protein S7 [Bacteriovoracia bacterium]